MSNFTPKVQFTTEFDGDQVSMELSRLKREDVIIMAPHMKGFDKEGNAVVSFDSKIEFSNVMTGILPKRVGNFNGLIDSDGGPIMLEEAIDETYFSDLIGCIMAELFKISRPKEKDVKEIKKSPSDMSEELEQETETSELSVG